MNELKQVFNYILGLGAPVLMPFVILAFGLTLRQGFARAFRAGLTVGIGFVGVQLIIGLLITTVGPQAKAFSQVLGTGLDVLDVGWPVGASASFAYPIAFLLFPCIIVLNIIMLATRTTRTMDIDIWNYWHFLYTGALVYAAFQSFWIALAATLLTAVIIFKLADWTAPAVEKHFGLPGISLPHTETVNWAPLMYALERVWARVPGLARLDVSPETVRKRLGLIGEPLVIGAVLGLAIGALGGYGALAKGGSAGTYIKNLLSVAVTTSAVLFILPKMVAILMEGLIPIAEGARDFIRRRFPGENIYVGLDAAVVIGHPAGMAVALILIPIALFLAVLLPGNRMLPFGDLAALPFYIIWAVAAARGNLVRGLLNSTLVVVAILYIGSDLADLTTTVAKTAGWDPAAGAGVAEAASFPAWSGIALGSHVVPWIILRLFDPTKSQFWIALGSAIVFAASWWWVRHDVKRVHEAS
ncbi:MAG: PTS galactitol transporter subunit IIC [Deltaproteobacteria bacterium]|nr:PTS galactitol transporter subunit IIC [Deltaproteobacteria bacterium]